MSETAYRKAYRVRLFGRGGYETTIPKIILDRAARSKGMNLNEFAKTHQVVFLFNDFEGFHAALRFEPTAEAQLDRLEKFIPREPETKQTNLFDELRAKLRGET